MAKRIFATLSVVLIIGLHLSESFAQPVPVAVDGCAKLARVVYAEVAAAAAYGPGKSGPWNIGFGQSDISVCSHTAKTVSQAFTSAMMSAGYDVSWARDDTNNGDYCWSGFLSQCYPERYPLSTSVHGADMAFVQKSWLLVSRSVMREMYNPFSSDEVRFRDDELQLQMGLSLRSVGAPHGR